MATIAVTGSTGQLGSELGILEEFHPNHDYLFFDSEELDLMNPASIPDVLGQYEIDYLINAAAYTNVDLAEKEMDNAMQINALALKTLGSYCDSEGIVILHISSDYVYHNGQNWPLKETDSTEPKGVYATSKLGGEINLLEVCPNSLVFRTSWLYSTFGNNFVKKMIHLGKERTDLSIVFDQIGAPTYARDLANALITIINTLESDDVELSEVVGIYNIANNGVASWYDFAKSIFEFNQQKVNLQPILSKDFTTPVIRPFYSVLDQSKLKEIFGISLPHWKDSLSKCIKALNRD